MVLPNHNYTPHIHTNRQDSREFFICKFDVNCDFYLVAVLNPQHINTASAQVFDNFNK